MTEENTTPPVACTLTEEEEATRSEKVQATLRSEFAGAEERDNGYTLRFDGTEEALVAVATFVASELKCCAFVDYHISVSPPYDETHLTITGPEGTKEMFGEGLVDALAEHA